MRPGALQPQVQSRNAFRSANREARLCLTVRLRDLLAKKGHSVLRLWPPDRIRIVAESQGKRGFSLADSQPIALFSGLRCGDEFCTQLAHRVVAQCPVGPGTFSSFPTSPFLDRFLFADNSGIDLGRRL